MDLEERKNTMINPKEKAKELIYKFYECDSVGHEMDGGGGINESKEYALICIDQIITSIEYREGMNPNFTGCEYYYKVKQEIKKYK